MSALGINLLSLFTDTARAKRYNHLLKTDVVKSLEEYPLLSYLAEYQNRDDAGKFVGIEFEAWLNTKTKIYGEMNNQVAFVRDPISLTSEGEQFIIDTLNFEGCAKDVCRIIDDYQMSNRSAAETLETVKSRIDKLQEEILRKQQATEVTPDIDRLLEQDTNQEGLTFPYAFQPLNESMRALTGGDFGIFAARPDAGKTSAVGNFVVHWAGQLPEGVPVVWINNEGAADRIWLRLYQIALGCNNEELKEYKKSGLLESRFNQATGGGRSQIKIYDAHGLDTAAIENIIKKEKPGVVVYDMIDNVKFSGIANHGGQRTDQVLESMYQWARNMCVIHDHVGIATSQISGEGENEKFPAMSMLKDSKTGKQGACDFIMMMTKSPDAADSRFFSLPKNKMAKKKKDPRCEIFFNGERGRFYERPYSEIELRKMALAGLTQ